MWARDIEICIGIWLLISPFVFGHGDGEIGFWATDLACGTAVLALALLSYVRRLRRIHLAELAAALWLLGYGWWTAYSNDPPPPPSQNHVIVGILVAMFAIIPSHASEPPPRIVAERSR